MQGVGENDWYRAGWIIDHVNIFVMWLSVPIVMLKSSLQDIFFQLQRAGKLNWNTYQFEK
jgi:hypothetical protein